MRKIMEGRLECINALIKELEEVFQCQICYNTKKAQSKFFYWTCHHVFCQDCVQLHKQCAICLTPVGKRGPNGPVSLADNENILGVYQSLLKNKSLNGISNRNSDKNKIVTPKGKGKRRPAVKLKSSDDNILSKLNDTITHDSQKKKKSSVFKRNHKGETPLFLACRKGDLAAMQELINEGADPNVKDNAGWTPLHDSIVFGRKEVIIFLLENGAMVNVPGLENMTPLHQSVMQGNHEITKLLIMYGANKNARNIYGYTPLDLIKKYDIKGMEDSLINTPAKYKSSKQALNVTISNEEPFMLCLFNLDEGEKLTYETAAKLFQFKTIHKPTTQNCATHMIVSSKTEPKVNWNVVTGVLSGCQVVDMKWIDDSIAKNSLQTLNEYQVMEGFYSGLHKSWLNRCNRLPGLFSGCHFYFGGSFELYKTKNLSFLKVELKAWIEKNGGIILSRNPDPESLALEKTIPYHAEPTSSLACTSYYIIYNKGNWDPVPKYNMPHMKTLPIEWLLASVVKFQLIDPVSIDSYEDIF